MKENTFVRFIKSSGIFFFGNVMTKLISFFLLPLYTGFISVEDMGYYDVSIVYINIGVSVLFFELWSAILRFMYDREQIEEKYRVIKTGSVIFGGSVIVYSAVFIMLWLFANIECLWLIYFTGLTQCMVSFYTFSARGLNKNIDFAISGIIGILVTASVNIAGILWLQMGYSALYIGTIIGHVLQCLYLEIRTKLLTISVKQKLNKSQVKEMVIYALPLCVNTVSFWLLTGFNRIVLNWIMGDAANGLYAVGNRFGTLITMLTTCFTYAWQDVSFSHAAQSGDYSGAFYSNACNLYSRFLLCGMLVALPVCYVGFNIMVNDSYNGALETIPLFLLVGVISAISSFIGNIFYAIKDTKTIFISTVIAAVMNVALVYPMIKLFGINGANISACVGFFINIVIRCVILGKKIQFHFNWKISVLLLIYSLIMFIWFSYLNVWQSIIMLLVNVAVSILFFRKECKQALSNVITKLSNKKKQ